MRIFLATELDGGTADIHIGSRKGSLGSGYFDDAVIFAMYLTLQFAYTQRKIYDDITKAQCYW